MCGSSSAPTQQSGHFLSFCRKDLYHFCTVFHSWSSWKNLSGDRRICCYQPQLFHKACPTLCESSHSLILWDPTERGRHEAASDSRCHYFSEITLWLQKIPRKWRLESLTEYQTRNLHVQWNSVRYPCWRFHPFQKGVVHLSTPYAPVFKSSIKRETNKIKQIITPITWHQKWAPRHSTSGTWVCKTFWKWFISSTHQNL